MSCDIDWHLGLMAGFCFGVGFTILVALCFRWAQQISE